MDMDILQELYDSEINWKIVTFWDAGFGWALGDEMNGWKESGTEYTLSLAEEALAVAAVKHFPESAFARKRM